MLSIFFHIIHWKRLLYFYFILFLLKYCLINGFGFETTLSFFDLGILVSSGVLIIASGYLFNYFYRKQKRNVKFPVKKAKEYAIIFAFLSLVLGFLLAFKIHKPNYSFLFIFGVIYTFFYAKKVRKKTFFSNLLLSFIKSFTILIVCWFDLPSNLSSSQWDLFFKLQIIILIYVVISFLSNIIREIIIDINNINSDNNFKHKTLPILLGRNRATKIALAICILVCLFVFFIAIIYVENTYLFTTIILLGTIPQLFIIYKLMTASSSNDYIFLYKLSNIGYFLAVLSIPIISYYIKHAIN
ncbi:hypothetical protein CXF68_14750 [Tenacibaculum sp. Bg11-29]|uniref:UbiA family prenyltransferase n=1 Tax=Tenacibaculum sp. Bg11-29 TaxID=2058306 RepID=UPI000C32839A|nr:UbiA family prenyltransferase [Tenacibaculum sp. Bg11-29]PKH51869.1 hypothetical protein CXF68_14750 [Tenacibaculum sp. Bg11-29]